MQYLLILWMEEQPMDDIPDEQARAMMEPWNTYTEELRASGALIGGEALTPSASATSLTTASGTLVVTDGPYAETKEQVMGYYVIDVPDLDAALAWAEKVPSAAYGTVEVRPIRVFPEGS